MCVVYEVKRFLSAENADAIPICLQVMNCCPFSVVYGSFQFVACRPNSNLCRVRDLGGFLSVCYLQALPKKIYMCRVEVSICHFQALLKSSCVRLEARDRGGDCRI